MTYRLYAPERTRPALKLSTLFLCLALLAATATAFAAPPALLPTNQLKNTFSDEVHPGQQKNFDLTYTQADGDPPTSLKMIVDTPSGSVTQAAPVPVAQDATKGIPISWTYTPENSGAYRVHFEAVSSTGGFARSPASSTDFYEFASVSPVTTYVTLAVGLFICLLFLPFVAYVAARSLNKRGDPAAAARVALLVGILAFCALAYQLLFKGSSNHNIGVVIEIIAAGAFLVVLFSRRRTA